MRGERSSAAPRGVEDPRAVLSRHGLRPKRSFGQNFLVNLALVERIADEVVSGGARQVIEIGAGAGTLTAALAARADRVLAIERDRDLAALLRLELGESEAVEVVEADAAALDLAELGAGRPTAVAGNLPYNLTGRLLRSIVGARHGIERAVVMVQSEVGERLLASPGTKSYGVLTVMCRAWLEPTLLWRVSAGSFHPRPRVSSVVVRLLPAAAPRAGELGEPALATLVRAAFASRRKTLRNTLGAAFEPAAVAEALAAEGIDPGARAETLEVEQLAALARRLVSP